MTATATLGTLTTGLEFQVRRLGDRIRSVEQEIAQLKTDIADLRERLGSHDGHARRDAS